MLTPAEHDYRRGKVTGSMMPVLMNAKTDAELYDLWATKVGLKEQPPQNYAMGLGSYLEPFILDYVERSTNHAITRRGEIVDHPSVSDICVKLDGYRAHDDTVVEVKFLGAYRSREDFLPYYYPQVLLQMLCTGARNGVLLVAQGTAEPVAHEIFRDEIYAGEMMQRIAAFLLCIKTLTPPVALPPIIPRDRWRVVDLSIESPNWGAELLLHLGVYEATKVDADAHDVAGKSARAIVPDDVGKVITPGFILERNRKGIVSIRRNT
jgi:hypothetical protein